MIAAELRAFEGNNLLDASSRGAEDSSRAKAGPYSFVGHLALAIAAGRGRPGTLMGMLTFYGDASGDNNSEAVFVAGAIATVEQWQAFESEWSGLLADFGMKPPFHMTDFMSGEGKYKRFKGQPDERKAFLMRAYGIVKRRVEVTFSTGCIMSDYHEVNKHFRLNETFGLPYTLCATQVMLKSQRWGKTEHDGERIHYVFEHGDRGWGQFSQFVIDSGFPTPIRAKKEECPALACPDILAWVVSRPVVEYKKGKLAGVSKGFVALFDSFPSKSGENWRVFEAKSLRAMCQRHSIPKR